MVLKYLPLCCLFFRLLLPIMFVLRPWTMAVHVAVLYSPWRGGAHIKQLCPALRSAEYQRAAQVLLVALGCHQYVVTEAVESSGMIQTHYT